MTKTYFSFVAFVAFISYVGYTRPWYSGQEFNQQYERHKTMATGIADFQETIAPTAADTELARESSRRLSRFLGKRPVGNHLPDFRLRVQADIDILTAVNGR